MPEKRPSQPPGAQLLWEIINLGSVGEAQVMEEKKKSVFDVNREITIKLTSPDGDKAIGLKFPSDSQWIDRQLRRKIVSKLLGRGKSQTLPTDSSENDGELLANIRTDGGNPEVDGFESGQILDRLSRCELDEVIREGNSYRVTTRVPGGITTHVYKIPSAKEQIQYRRGYASSVDGRGRQEVTVNLQAAADLDKKIRIGTEGYAGGIVPIVHQATAINALMEIIDSRESEDSENF
jgi:hypothetical protein